MTRTEYGAPQTATEPAPVPKSKPTTSAARIPPKPQLVREKRNAPSRSPSPSVTTKPSPPQEKKPVPAPEEKPNTVPQMKTSAPAGDKETSRATGQNKKTPDTEQADLSTTRDAPSSSHEPARKRRHTVEEAIKILEEAYGDEARMQVDEEDLPPAMSKAAPPQKRDSDRDFEVRAGDQLRQLQMEALANVANFWRTVAVPPSRESQMIDTQLFSKLEVTYLRRGADFSELAGSLGINNATKRARQLARIRGAAPSSNQDQYLQRVMEYNSTILKLRTQFRR